MKAKYYEDTSINGITIRFYMNEKGEIVQAERLD